MKSLCPDLQEPPKTEKATAGKKTKAKVQHVGSNKKGTKANRLSVYDVTKLIKDKEITSRLQLVCLAIQQEREGKTALAEFIANRGSRVVEEVIALAKEFSLAEAKHSRSQKTRIKLLQEQQNAECCDGCHGKWLSAAINLLEQHGIIVTAFFQALYTALSEGRGKYRKHLYLWPKQHWKNFYIAAFEEGLFYLL